MSQRNSEFPVSHSGLNYALSSEPLLLSGMKILFDQSASVYLVNLQSKTQNSASLAYPTFSESKSYYSRQLAFDPTNSKDWESFNKDAPEQYIQDVKLWSNTVYPPGLKSLLPAESEKMAILKRIFAILRFGELRYRDSQRSEIWKNWDKPTASALSHGGRVLIRIHSNAYPKMLPKMQSPTIHCFWNWLVRQEFVSSETPYTNDTAKLLKRSHATHAITLKLPDGPSEIKQFRTLPEDGHYGMNIPLGGITGLDSQGKPIVSDGTHGHLYFRYRVFSLAEREASGWDCAILIGCENARPRFFKDGKSRKSHLKGVKHSDVGSTNKISATGGSKWIWEDKKTNIFKKINDRNGVPSPVDCLRIDISESKVLAEIVTSADNKSVDIDQFNQWLMYPYESISAISRIPTGEDSGDLKLTPEEVQEVEEILEAEDEDEDEAKEIQVAEEETSR